jgi:hypothetical protein
MSPPSRPRPRGRLPSVALVSEEQVSHGAVLMSYVTAIQNIPRVVPQGLAPYLAVVMTVVTLLVVWAALCAI